ncbi:MAG TPA: ABC transporter substrate-binding protein [Spirillospora sp.]|nr:ABC transporter substrate-binding protein [Spirillospora sp.]
MISSRWQKWTIIVLSLSLILMIGLQVTAQERAREETLIVAINGQIADPTNLNIYAPGVSRSNTGLHQVIYEYFFYQNLQTGEYIPWLAERYQYNEDFTSISVKLREGVEWSDGQPFTSADVVFTYNLLFDNPGMTWASEVSNNVESVEAVDDLNVTFNLKTSNPRYHLNREAFPAVGIWGGITILPQHIWEGQDPLTFKSSDPIGTGPYTLASASQNAMIYERNDNWWGNKVFGRLPAPKYISFQYVGPETSTAFALAADEIDTPNIGILSKGSFLEVVNRNPNVSAWSADAPYAWLDPCPRPLMVQTATPPWDDPQMRHALSFLIDRQAVVDLAYEGTTVPAWGVWPEYDGLLPYFEAVEDLVAQYRVGEYDPDAAEEIFTSLGYTKNSEGMWQSADGTVLSVTYVVNSASTEEMKVSAVVADQLKNGGIEVDVQPLQDPTLASTVLAGDYTIKLQSFCPGYIYDNLELYHGKYYVPLGEPAPWYERNSFRYNNPAFNEIVDQMAVLPPEDVDQNVPLFRQAVELLFQDMPTIPMVQAPALVPFSSTYWTGWPSAENPWNMPVSWWATFNLVITGYPDPETGEWVGGIQPAGG